MRYLISPDEKLCLFWTQKCGCSTATEIFFNYIGYDYSKGPSNEQKLQIKGQPRTPTLGQPILIHQDRRRYQRTQPKEIPPESVKIQIVRNPYDRAVSGFFFYLYSFFRRAHNKEITNQDFQKFLLKLSKDKLISSNGLETTKLEEIFLSLFTSINSLNWIIPGFSVWTTRDWLYNHLFQPQYITDNLDFVLKLENLESDINLFNQKFNFSLKNSRLDTHSVRKRIGKDLYYDLVSQIYSEDNKKIIQQLHKKDFEYFNYPI